MPKNKKTGKPVPFSRVKKLKLKPSMATRILLIEAGIEATQKCKKEDERRPRLRILRDGGSVCQA